MVVEQGRGGVEAASSSWLDPFRRAHQLRILTTVSVDDITRAVAILGAHRRDPPPITRALSNLTFFCWGRNG
ncbi:hypothetical protein D6T63_10380 [Arthrobacter cheniae]|uniref:Uncharacterized protein n=1 Tax=Arthrobacter cheniae TaxID=1258888 RepID=A0A3A5MCL1_9MICC|nr:hypothetical protein D6T63_10380 [Arthrobacter cheniae]